LCLEGQRGQSAPSQGKPNQKTCQFCHS
jgi:hypothetical protein